jgi:hypothetical protein
LPRKKRKAPRTTTGELMRKVRKPMAPPAKIEEDLRKYRRTRERHRLREAIADPTGESDD